MKISASKLIANMVNALRSTGPRSAEGKLASSVNARRHGLAALPTSELAKELKRRIKRAVPMVSNDAKMEDSD